MVEFNLSEKRFWIDRSNARGRKNKNQHIGFKSKPRYLEKDIKEFIKIVIEEDLEMCKVCGGSHGKWLDKDDFVKRFKQRAGEKLI